MSYLFSVPMWSVKLFECIHALREVRLYWTPKLGNVSGRTYFLLQSYSKENHCKPLPKKNYIFIYFWIHVTSLWYSLFYLSLCNWMKKKTTAKIKAKNTSLFLLVKKNEARHLQVTGNESTLNRKWITGNELTVVLQKCTPRQFWELL